MILIDILAFFLSDEKRQLRFCIIKKKKFFSKNTSCFETIFYVMDNISDIKNTSKLVLQPTVSFFTDYPKSYPDPSADPN